MRREIGDRVLAALFGDESAPERGEALLGDGAGLVEDASLSPRRRVWISATSRGTKAATRNSGSPAPAKSAALATAVSGTANGMILTVATIWRGSTTAKGGRVPRVTASSTRLSRSSRSRSKTRRPRASANRLARPVKALATVMLGPAAAAAMRPAASSSRRSPGSSRATMICARPAAAIASRSARNSTRPFFSTVAPSFRLCARIAPSASPTGTSPNFIRPRLFRRGAGFASSGQGSRPRSRPVRRHRSRGRSGRGCARDRYR
jgi:hypothetical protein